MSAKPFDPTKPHATVHGASRFAFEQNGNLYFADGTLYREGAADEGTAAPAGKNVIAVGDRNVVLDGLDAEQLRALAAEIGIKVHSQAGPAKLIEKIMASVNDSESGDQLDQQQAS